MATSTGRGGAGNIKPPSNIAAPNQNDFVTPHIKQQVYTTGRGGTGNMATNLKEAPEYARAAQDVDAPLRRETSNTDPNQFLHTGRGGGGNFVRSGSKEGDESAREKIRREAAARAGANGNGNGNGEGAASGVANGSRPGTAESMGTGSGNGETGVVEGERPKKARGGSFVEGGRKLLGLVKGRGTSSRNVNESAIDEK